MTKDRWPKPLTAALHGVFGDIVQTIAPETEADPAAILVQLLALFANVIGRGPHFRVGTDLHYLTLFAVIVATSAKGRKGMSKNQARHVFESIDTDWVTHCNAQGLSSGEGLVYAVRDATTKMKPVMKHGRVVDYEKVVEDHGVNDKRLMIIEPEFASTLKVMNRDGSTLSPVIRLAWDGEDLRTLTKNSAIRSTGPHIGIIGHITADELRRNLEATETANGFGNRFLWVLAKRSRELPEGGVAVALEAFAARLQSAIEEARYAPELRRDEAAKASWAALYSKLSAGRPGMLGSMTARAEAQVMRLACLYALSDRVQSVTVTHLKAALDLWRYCFESTACLFGDRIGDPVADVVLGQLRRLHPERMTKTEISYLFHRNKPAEEIDRALATLLEHQLVTVDRDRGTNGRPTEWWGYSGCEIAGEEIDEKGEKSPLTAEDISPNSSISSPRISSRERRF
jgi:hypothetical protein